MHSEPMLPTGQFCAQVLCHQPRIDSCHATAQHDSNTSSQPQQIKDGAKRDMLLRVCASKAGGLDASQCLQGSRNDAR